VDRLAFDEALARLRAALAERPPRRLELPGFRPAAVLVPILARPAGPTLLFTRRTELVPRHKGEISFPGGGREPDEDALDAALREAEEEVGIPPARVEVLGALDDLPSVTGYLVTPVIGAMREPPERFVAQEFEVLEPFEVPLVRLLTPGVRRSEWWDAGRIPAHLAPPLLESRASFEDYDAEHHRFRVWFFDAAPEQVIWGLTGRILAMLLDRAFGPPPVTLP
jgi:8-oxo-dGTP pyrophosphatase MutT (NUDIX family)